MNLKQRLLLIKRINESRKDKGKKKKITLDSVKTEFGLISFIYDCQKDKVIIENLSTRKPIRL